MDNPIKYLARFKVETKTPLAIGSGRNGLLNERLIAKDANGLPFMPGTGLAGIVRHELEKDASLKARIPGLFGFQTPGEKEGLGSRIVFSPGMLVGLDGVSVMEGLQEINYECQYFQAFKVLPQRDHVRINHLGVASKTGKFEDQLVHRGTRFVFELELEGTEDDETIWGKILDILNHPSFRVGAGSRKGFGALQVLECRTKAFDLRLEKDFKEYMVRSSSLNEPVSNWLEYGASSGANTWLHYQIHLAPESFFLFGSGTRSQQADITPKKEKCFVWTMENGPVLKEYTLIPATSIKGAISHRLAFNYNFAKKEAIEKLVAGLALPPFDHEQAIKELIQDHLPEPIEQLEYAPDSSAWKELELTVRNLVIDHSQRWKEYREQAVKFKEYSEHPTLPVGEHNPAVTDLFGAAKKETAGARGKAVFSDIYLPEMEVPHFFNHVSLDRFTGGARAGALFTQEVSASAQWPALDIFIEREAFEVWEIRVAFEKTLDELCNGNLPLGGSSAKGHGCFKGDWKIV